MKKNNLFAIIAITTLLGSCTEIVAPDISNINVILMSPPDSFVSTGSTVYFKWDKLEHAESYNIQVVSPSFAAPIKWIVDSIGSMTSLTINLVPGTYEWRVRGENFSYLSDYSTRILSILNIPDISSETIILLSPKNNDTTNRKKVFFHWASLPNTDSYRFVLNLDGLVVENTEVVYDTLTINIINGDGNYEWKVRGQNEFYNTAYFSRRFLADTTRPGIPVLKLPTTNEILTDTTVEFVWDRPTTLGSEIIDSLLVSSDSLFSLPVISVKTVNKTYINIMQHGTFFWKVKSFDKAGNESMYSSCQRFTVSAK